MIPAAIRAAWLALASVLVSTALSAAPAPGVSDAAAPRVLLRLEAREETFGILSFPQHELAYAGLELLTDGRLRAAVFGHPGTLDLAGPPTVTIHTGELDRARLGRVGELLAEARIGQAESCHAHRAFLFFASASVQTQRLTWFGRGTRARAVSLTEGPSCEPALVELVAILREAFGELLAAPP